MARAVDDLLPEYDVHEVHRRTYAAEPAAVREALESLRTSDLRLTRLLFAVRALPALVTGAKVARDDGPLLDRLPAAGFARLVDTPYEAAFAVIGRFWRPDGGRREAMPDAESFRAFAEPGWAKAVMSFELRRRDDGDTELVTETRIKTTSDGARRAFAAYWLLVGTGSALIRSEILAAVARRVEGRAAA